jgi:hypothetical protein
MGETSRNVGEGGGEIGERVWFVTAGASSLKRLLRTVPTSFSASHVVASVIRVPGHAFTVCDIFATAQVVQLTRSVRCASPVHMTTHFWCTIP